MGLHMETSQTNKVSASKMRPELLIEARKVAKALRSMVEDATPRLDTLDADRILEKIDCFADLGGQLQALFTRIEAMDTDSETLAETAECRELRREIRTDLDAASIFIVPCRAALERQIDNIKSELLLTQRKRQISAYIRLPLLGEDENSTFDRRK